MTVSQTSFRDAVLDSTLAVPEGLTDSQNAPAGARFSVYRNNVVLSLSEALATAFPLVRKLIGGATFDRLAKLYVRANPPSSPLMMHYGEAFPAFLRVFEPLAHIGYLPDCAALDLAKRQSYHAADAKAFDPNVLMQDNVAELTFTVAPATQVLRSSWPLFDLYRFNTEPNAPKLRAVQQDVLITRPEFDPQVHLLPEGCADWLSQLQTGATLGEAVEATSQSHKKFDLTTALTLVTTSGALAQNNSKDSA